MSDQRQYADKLSNDLASLQIDRSEDRPRRGGAIVKVLIALGLIAGLAVGAVMAWPYVEAQIFKTEVAAGEIASVSPAQSQMTLTAAGFVVARTLSRISATTSGRVSRVHVVEGQEVEQGAVLVELDASDQESAIASARARVLAAQARAAQARAGLAETQQQAVRSRALLESGALSRSEVEDLDARIATMGEGIDVAVAEVRAAQAEVHALEVGQRNLTIVAPIPGTVITEPVEVGEIVTPQTEVVQIADFDSLVVEVDVPEGRLSLVRVGSPAQIVLDAYPDRRYRGEVVEIARRVNRQRAAVPVRVRFLEPATDALPDMSSHVSFLREALTEEQLRAASRIVVPAEAIVSRGGRDVVFEIDDGVVRERPIRVGEETPDGRVLLDGPDVGARVVLNPPATLADGQSVRERESDD
jgi:HlyD family secretion protein